MKKLVVLLTLLFCLLSGTTYLYYTHWRSQQQRTAAIPYIPSKAILVYEVTDFNRKWKRFQQTSIGKELSTLPPFAAIEQAMSWLKKDLLEDVHKLNNVPLIVSLHQPEQGAPPAYLFYFNTHDVATQEFFAAMMAQKKKSQAYHTTTRKCANSKIVSWSKEGTTQQLYYIKRKQHIIVSSSTALIEEVAHALASNNTGSFLRLHKSENAHGSLFINLKQLSQLENTLFKPNQVNSFSNTLATLAQESQLDLKLTPHCLVVSGPLTAPIASHQYLINTIKGQEPGPIQLASYLPQRAAVLQHVTFSNADQLLESWQQYSKKSEKPDDLLPATLLPLLQGEIAHCTLPAKEGHTAGQLVLMKVTDAQAFSSVLKTAKALTPAASLPGRAYHLKSDCFQYSLPGVLFSSFKATYLMQVDDYVLLADRKNTLKTWYAQYKQGKTWAKSPSKKAWLASTLDQAHHTWLVDVPQAWCVIRQSLQPRWRQVLKNHPAPAIDVSLQLLGDDTNGCYMSVLVKNKKTKQPEISRRQRAAILSTPTTLAILPENPFFQAEAPLVHAPWLVKSHRGKGHYVMLQDARHQVYLLAPTGKLLWKKTLEGPITTNIFEIDFLKNNKTQYLFATDQKLHLVDYYGRAIGSYPQPLPAPAQLQVVDYSKNKQYRFLLATAQGAIYLKDKQGKNLPGWNPQSLGHAFASVPFHLRARGRDYFLALQTNGTLQAFNRRGQSYPGFPVVLNTPVHNPLMVRKTAAGTVLTVLTDGGKQVDVNLAGQVKKITPLDRATSTSRFLVCPNQVSEGSYAMLHQEADKVVVMDEAMNLRFEIPYAKKGLLAQYYDFGKGKQFYVLTSPEEQLTSLYDPAGKRLLAAPWKNGYEARLLFSKAKNQLSVYGCAGANCIKYVLPLDTKKIDSR